MGIVIKNVLTSDECDLLISYNKKFYPSSVYNPNTKKMETHSNIRNVFQSHIELPNWFESRIKEQLSNNGYYLTKSITQHYFLKYTQGTYFKPHRDSAPVGTATKKITLMVELSNSTDYSGGEFIIEGESIIRDKGDVILFDSYKLHELKEVTNGTRLSFVCWILDTQLSTYKKSLL